MIEEKSIYTISPLLSKNSLDEFSTCIVFIAPFMPFFARTNARTLY
jgi:hypothetical protein